MINPDAGWSLDDVVSRPIDGEPEVGFDCLSEDQNSFLYERAWEDYQARASTTRLFYIKGILAGFTTTCAASFVLTSKEKPRELRYKKLTAILLAQMAADRKFQGCGLGSFMLAYIVQRAIEFGDIAACRFVILDARPDLVRFYEKQGFEINQSEGRARRLESEKSGGDPNLLPVSMRFDLRER